MSGRSTSGLFAVKAVQTASVDRRATSAKVRHTSPDQDVNRLQPWLPPLTYLIIIICTALKRWMILNI